MKITSFYGSKSTLQNWSVPTLRECWRRYNFLAIATVLCGFIFFFDVSDLYADQQAEVNYICIDDLSKAHNVYCRHVDHYFVLFNKKQDSVEFVSTKKFFPNQLVILLSDISAREIEGKLEIKSLITKEKIGFKNCFFLKSASDNGVILNHLVLNGKEFNVDCLIESIKETLLGKEGQVFTSNYFNQLRKIVDKELLP